MEITVEMIQAAARVINSRLQTTVTLPEMHELALQALAAAAEAAPQPPEQHLLTAALAHRACHSAEHDPLNGKLHGYCMVCGVPWPCDTAKQFLAPQPPADPRVAELEADVARLSAIRLMDDLDRIELLGLRKDIQDVFDRAEAAEAKVAELKTKVERLKTKAENYRLAWNKACDETLAAEAKVARVEAEIAGWVKRPIYAQRIKEALSDGEAG
jgi:hypothetical protein